VERDDIYYLHAFQYIEINAGYTTSEDRLVSESRKTKWNQSSFNSTTKRKHLVHSSVSVENRSLYDLTGTSSSVAPPLSPRKDLHDLNLKLWFVLRIFYLWNRKNKFVRNRSPRKHGIFPRGQRFKLWFVLRIFYLWNRKNKFVRNRSPRKHGSEGSQSLGLENSP
jgi:hypothetical protein